MKVQCLGFQAFRLLELLANNCIIEDLPSGATVYKPMEQNVEKPLELFQSITDHAWFAPRAVIENDASFIHFIPYIVLHDNAGRFLGFNRAAKPGVGEARLHGKFCIGFGGHVDLEDLSMFLTGNGTDGPVIDIPGTLYNNACRELWEEIFEGQDNAQIVIEANSEKLLKVRGFIFDPTNDVGKHHLGILMTLNVEEIGLTLEQALEFNPEPSVLNLGIWAKGPVTEAGESPETWTSIAMDQLF